jgi:hypothetical protein
LVFIFSISFPISSCCPRDELHLLTRQSQTNPDTPSESFSEIAYLGHNQSHPGPKAHKNAYLAVPSPKEATRLIIDWRTGESGSLDEPIPLAYDKLRRLAGRYMRRESQGHTLQTSALVNETYLRLVDQESVQWQNRTHCCLP